ncbi:hypothetical protein OV450_5177 [Actinobacteria bacterium OV450]|nr:hypothetical protein OV450_5177 [Actinobacteria bacterium OV450]
MAMDEIGPQPSSREPEKWYKFWRWGVWTWCLITLAIGSAAGAAFTKYRAEHSGTQATYDFLLIIGSIFEGMLIACVIGLFVDPAFKKHFVRELGPEYFWITKALNIPPNVRRQVEELASRAEYLRRVTWLLDFDWCDDNPRHLVVKVHADANGYSTSPDGYLFKPHLWIPETTSDHHVSKHTALEFLIPDHDWQVKLKESELDDLAQLSGDQAAERWLSMARTQLEGREPRVPQMATFVIRRDTKLYPSGNLLPLRIRYITTANQFHLVGRALVDLEISFHHATGENKKCNARQPNIIEAAPTITFPGQVTVISWRVVGEIEGHEDGEHAEESENKIGEGDTSERSDNNAARHVATNHSPKKSDQ